MSDVCWGSETRSPGRHQAGGGALGQDPELDAIGDRWMDARMGGDEMRRVLRNGRRPASLSVGPGEGEGVTYLEAEGELDAVEVHP